MHKGKSFDNCQSCDFAKKVQWLFFTKNDLGNFFFTNNDLGPFFTKNDLGPFFTKNDLGT